MLLLGSLHDSILHAGHVPRRLLRPHQSKLVTQHSFLRETLEALWNTSTNHNASSMQKHISPVQGRHGCCTFMAGHNSARLRVLRQSSKRGVGQAATATLSTTQREGQERDQGNHIADRISEAATPHPLDPSIPHTGQIHRRLKTISPDPKLFHGDSQQLYSASQAILGVLERSSLSKERQEEQVSLLLRHYPRGSEKHSRNPRPFGGAQRLCDKSDQLVYYTKRRRAFASVS